MTKQAEHERHRVLGGGDGVAGRGVDDHHAGARRRLDVDAIDPDARHSDDAQPRRRRGKQLRIDASLRSDDESVPAAILGQEREQVASAQAEVESRSRARRTRRRARAGPRARRRGCGPWWPRVYGLLMAIRRQAPARRTQGTDRQWTSWRSLGYRAVQHQVRAPPRPATATAPLPVNGPNAPLMASSAVSAEP